MVVPNVSRIVLSNYSCKSTSYAHINKSLDSITKINYQKSNHLSIIFQNYEVGKRQLEF